jgi:hypothetical protein
VPALSANVVIPILAPILTGLYEDPDRLVQLVLVDLPDILAAHWSTYWRAREALAVAPHLYPNPAAEHLSIDNERYMRAKVADIYHTHLPLLSVSPSPGFTPSTDGPYRNPIPPGQFTLSPVYLTAMTDALLRLHLPAKEYDCSVERVMTREVVARVILGAVGSKLGEGWFWWTLGLRLLPDISASLPKKSAEQARDAGLSGAMESVMRLFSKFYAGVILLWTMGISLFARYTAAPPTKDLYRNCARPWLSLGRELLGTEGRLGISSKRWEVRLSWGLLEGLIALFGPFIDR